MKKLLLVFCISLLIVMFGFRASAQTFDWSCFPTSGVILADNNVIANLNLTSANCSVANGWVVQCQGTGEQRILTSNVGGNPYIRMQKVGTDATFNFARILTASGSQFTLRSISVTPTAVGALAGGDQVITLHAYKGGRELGSTSTAAFNAFGLVNIPESQLGAFVNIDEVRFTSDKAAAFGVGIDDVVISTGATVPSVTTDNSTSVTASSATLTGTVTADGGAAVTEKGIVYATTANPTTVNTKLTNGTGTGAISVSASGLAGSTTYHYRAYATNSIGTSYGADQTFTTLAANNLPVAVADNYSFKTGQALTVAAPGILGNDTDADGDPLTAILVFGPANGTLILNLNGSFTYTSTGATNDQFTYKVNDGKGDGNTITVSLSHVNSNPIANNDLSNTNQNIPSTGNVLTNDTDPDGNALTASLVTAPVNGTVVLNADGSFTYTPNNNYAGSDSLLYQVCDNGTPSLCDTATLVFNVSAVNQLPVAVADNYNIKTNQTLTIAAPGVLSNDTDADGDPITAILVNGPVNGTLTLNPNGSFTYASTGPASDNFTYKANDSKGDGNIVTVSLTHANSSPVANNDIYNTNQNIPSTGNVLANDTDPDGNALTASLVTAPVNGTVVLNADGSVTYTPNNDYAGSDSLRYQVCDNGTPSLCDTATATFNIAAVNQPPVVTASAGTTVYGAVPVIVDPGITVADVDNTTLFSAFLTIQTGFQGGDQLAFAPTGDVGNITASPGAPGTFILNSVGSSATLAQWQNALRSITYQSTSANTGDRTITLMVSDGLHNSTTAFKTITYAPSTISTTGTLSTLATTYGTASSSGTFNVSGLRLSAGILVTAPAGFEVSANNTTFTPTVTIGAAGNIASTPVYIRLAAGSGAGTYSGDIVLSSTGVSDVKVATVASTVNRKALTVTAKNITKTYGQALTDGATTTEFTATGLVGTETVGNMLIAYGTGAAANAAVNTYTGSVTASAAGGGTFTPANYTINYVAGNIVVNKAALTVIASNKGKAFGTTLTSGSGSTDFTSTGLVGTETIGSVTINYGVGGTALAPVGTYHIIPSAATGGTFNANNYTITYQVGTLTVGQTILTITANNVTKIYGAGVPALSVTYSGFVGTDDPSSLTTQPTISTTAVPNSPVNTYAITASGAVSANYTIVYKPGTLTVTPATLTITANNATKIYGAPVPALSVSYSGFVGTDNATSLTTAPTITTTAVTNSPVNTYPITASGAASANYTFVYKPGALTVTKAALTITANNATKIYGATVPALNVSYSGFVGTDDASSLTTAPTVNTTAVTNSPVNTYPITASEAVSSNYTITYKQGTLTVTRATLTIIANDKTKSYGQALTGGAGSTDFTSAGLVNSETVGSVTITYGTGAAAGATVNTYIGSVVASAATGGTFAPGNYTISYVAGDIIVGKKVLTITANNATKTYGAANPALSVSYSGFTVGDDASSLTTAPTVSTTAVTNSAVNTYPVTASGAVSANYTIVYKPGILTINPATLTITANNKNKLYGEALTGGAGSTAFTSAGLINSETIGTVTIAYGAGSAAGAVADAYTGSVTVSAATGGTFAPGNYHISYVAGDIIVGKVAVTVTANTKTKTYGDIDPALTYSVTGGALVGTDAFTGTLGRDAGENAGTYAIKQGSLALSANYILTYKGANLTIAKKAITVTADPQTKPYGAADPALTYRVTNGTLAFADTFSGALSRDAGENAGTYAIKQGSLALSSNYTLTYNGADLTIIQKALTITANNATKTYGSVNPALTVSYSGFTGTDDESSLTTAPTVSTTAVTGSPVNTYPVTTSGAVSANYAIVYKPGILTVTPAALTITANNATKTYGSVNPALSVSYNGFVGTDNASSLTTEPTIATTAVANSPVNTYPVTASGAVSSNYTIAYKPGILTVTPVALTITANNKTKLYGQILTGGTGLTAFTSTGLVNSETIGSVTITYGTGAAANAAVNTYTGSVVASAATGGSFTSGNYKITYVAGNIIVNQVTLTITANNQSKIYGSANPALSLSYNGFINGDNNSSFATKPSVSTTATAASGAGTYPITASGAVIANYKIVYVPGTLIINKATLTITAENKSRLYGAPNPALTAAYSGFVNGDDKESLTTLPVLTTPANTTSTPGTYPITASGTVSSNYTFNYVPGKLMVNPLSDANLINLVLSSGTLSPAFTSGNLAYTTQVDNDVDHIRLTLTFDATATARVNGTSTSNNHESYSIPLNTGNNTITIVVTAQDHTTTNTYTLLVYRGADQKDLVVTNILTPNGDGKNDVWVIQDIQLYPNNIVTVYDRGGRTVYTKHGYTNDWNGMYGGSPLTEGTYYYLIDLGPQQRKFKGYITIVRNR
ncbi:MBG domain-containing protein [Mucilaginibacter sabulilitoris]|uniref:MBG domain-containing protein n=1 Tax=Mucilaginibacter sabulilitoris TaxID=1173583 RepID=A0ABZ0TV91_9SPHI|nr:MBG domain-containing protein [Mucilaginibacter sabulilitoris]WPU97007.1 MBG domain-containing protein [Mucilaginibacter sabulilitoris]